MFQENLHNSNRFRYKSDSNTTVAADGETGLASLLLRSSFFFLTYDGDGLILCVSQHPDRISDEVMGQNRQSGLWIIRKLANI